MILTSHWSKPKTGGEQSLCPKCGWSGTLSECAHRADAIVLCPKCNHWVELKDPQKAAKLQEKKTMKQLKMFDNNGRPPDKHSKALEDVEVFDNRGATFDRYFVVVGRETYTMSHNPLSPQGMNQYAGPKESTGRPWNAGGGSLGRLLDHIPPESVPAILERIEDQNRQ